MIIGLLFWTVTIGNFAFANNSNLKALDLSGPKAINGQVIFEANDAGESIGISLEDYKKYTGEDFLFLDSGFFDFKKSFEEVSSYITPTLEDAYDVFILVNVSYQAYGNPSDNVPSQHLRVLRKTKSGQKVFNRNYAGNITGIKNSILGAEDYQEVFKGVDAVIPVSSGASHFSADPQPYVDTPTGIYRINHTRSLKRRYGKGMWHSLYFDLIYPWGNRESGLAIHGTSPGLYRKLGTQQSHGCVRIRQDQANVLYNTLLSSEYSRMLPDLNRKQRLKSERRDSNGKVILRKGQSALMILFYGYNGQAGLNI